MSWAIASSILRMFSACCSSCECVENLDSFVTPSTSWATSAPKRSSTSARLYSVSSGTSWRRAASMAGRVEAELREDQGGRDRVRDVRLARRPQLALVGDDGEVEGAGHGRGVGPGRGGRDLREELPTQDRQRPVGGPLAASG